MRPKNLYATKFPPTNFTELLIAHQLSKIKTRSYWKQFADYIYCIFNVFSVIIETFIFLLENKMYSFINFVKKCWNFCSLYFETLPAFSTNQNILDMSFHPQLPQFLNHCLFARINATSNSSMNTHY